MNSSIVPELSPSVFLGIVRDFIGIVQCNALRGNKSTTVDQCEQLCGEGPHPFDRWEVVNAITTWVLLLFVLVSNVQYSNFQLGTSPSRGRWWARIRDVVLSHSLVASHLLANPIDYIFSHLEKLEAMRQVRLKVEKRGAAESVATVCIALADLNGEVIESGIYKALEESEESENPEEPEESMLLSVKSSKPSTAAGQATTANPARGGET